MEEKRPKIRVCLSGATGWVGRELCLAFSRSEKIELVAAAARKSAGQKLGQAIGADALDIPISASAAEALQTPCDVFVDYTRPEVVLENVRLAISAGVDVVIGTSGISEEQFANIDALARGNGVGVLACGNFALTAILLQKLALLAGRVFPDWEILDYASPSKPDAPSATTRELAAKMFQVRTNAARPVLGDPASRGATIAESQLHSVRVPGFAFAFEILFGSVGERIHLRHEAGASARPYVAGTIFAIENVSSIKGLQRGLDAFLPDIS